MALYSAMKKKSARQQAKERDEILAACERTRQACNKLTDDERRRLREKGREAMDRIGPVDSHAENECLLASGHGPAHLRHMSKKPEPARRKKRIDWDAVSEQTRQRCNKLSDEDHDRLFEEAVRIINASDAKVSVRRR